MLFVTVCIASGITYAGVKTWVKLRPRRRQNWLIRVDDQAVDENASSTAVNETDGDSDSTPQYFRLASVSLGLSIAGAVLYTPLSLASVPLTVYISLPALENAYVALFSELRFKMVVLHATVVMFTLATKHYVLASLFNWLYYYLAIMARQLRNLNKIVTLELENSYRKLMSQIYGTSPRTAWVLSDGVGVEVPLEELRAGDVIVVSASEMIPIEGTIVEGTAEVVQLRSNRGSQARQACPGDIVSPSTMVLSGRLNIRVVRV